jgi:Flp pilus assembly protein TadD
MSAASARAKTLLGADLAILKPLAAESPGDPAVRFALGRAHADLGERREAIAAFGEAVRLNPRHDKAWLALAEQVRRPIYSDAVDHWRNFEPWLNPPKDALEAGGIA